MVVGGHIVFASRMLVAGGAQPVPLVFQLRGMRIVAIGTANPFGVHLALEKRSVDVDLILNLPIGMIESLTQQSRFKII